MAEVEGSVGRRFGDAVDPLLVSVRSGAPVSMPGMMDTILDLGLTDGTEAGLARSPVTRRSRATATTASGRCSATSSGRTRLTTRGSSSASRSRRSSGPGTATGPGPTAGGRGSPTTGTGVTVQAMVFGNRGPESATGVVFTRNPATGEPGLYGDVMFGAQGEDVVAGTHRTEPLPSLDQRLPRSPPNCARTAPAWRPTTATCATSSSPSRRAASGSSRCGSASGARGPRCGSPSRWPTTSGSRCAPRGRGAGRAPARNPPHVATGLIGTPRRWRQAWPRHRAWRPARS